MNHVLGTQINQHRLVDGNVDFVQHLHVVLAGGIGGVNAEDVVVGHQLHVLPAKFSIRAGIARVPRELLRDDLDHRGFFGCGKMAHVFRPQRHGDAEQQHGLDGNNGEFDVAGHFALGALVIGLFAARGVEAEQHIAEVNDPADEEREHQPVDINHEVVHGLAGGRGEFGQTKDVVGKPVFHTFVASGEFVCVAASSASLLRMT